MRRRSLAFALAAAGTASVLAPPAEAFFGLGATPVSVSIARMEQADGRTTAVDLSTDGNVVVFETLARNLFADDDPDPPGQFHRGGVFRRDLATGRLDLVAHGSLVDKASGQILVRGAQNPSVSADGRYVVFSTGEQLAAEDGNTHVDAYVRDMDLPRSAPGAFTLVSSEDGPARSVAYDTPAPDSDFPGRNPGSEVRAGAGISDDGRRVVFRTLTGSDLAGPGTPAQQHFVRDLRPAVPRTLLVTRDRDTGEPIPVQNGGPSVISADGSTVAWVGQAAPRQTRMVGGESTDPLAFTYFWRRVDGANPPTRRITGIADPDDPACGPGGAIGGEAPAIVPCDGVLSQPEAATSSITDTPPALSADGRRVAFLTGSSVRPDFNLPAVDLFVTDMADGVSRKLGTVELTRDAVRGGNQTSGSIDGLALAAGGRYAAIATRRTRFLLPALALVDAERATAGPRELLLVDLQARTLERVLRTVRGDDLDQDVDTGLALSGDGRRLAFVSTSPSLFVGDANQVADAFVVERTPPPLSPPPDAGVADLPGPSAELLPPDPVVPAKRLTAFVRKAPAGQVRIEVRAPAAGDLEATVRGRLPNRDGKPAGAAKVLSAGEQTARRKSTVSLVLRLRSDRVTPARKAGSLTGQASLLFITRRGEEYRRTLTVTFKAPPKAKQRTRRPSSRRGR